MKRTVVARSAAALAVASLALAGGGLGPAAARATHPARHPSGRHASARSSVIVLLRDQHRRSAPAQRRAAVGADQARVGSNIAELGGRTTARYQTLNAVAATVPTATLAALRANPAVAEVVPDLLWHLPRQAAADPAGPGTTTAASSSAATPAATGSQICPTDPSQPLLEPEALQQTHTASDDAAAATARSLGYDGSGVKVGVIADGLDVDQPDLIRADGTHVITDYRDFSGDGTDSATSGAEALGDAASIGAQGRTVYDISQYVNVAHPLPTGCTIRVEGMAPGASMVAMKIFSNALLTAPTSTIIQAIDWAVSADHVDVLNESFGSNPYPDDATDPISLFNRQAYEDGVTVVASTGDAGPGNTLGTAATDPWVIGVAASTSERTYAQQTLYGFQFSNGHYTSDEISSLSSGGISQLGGVPDLTAPGDLNWSLCSDATLPDGSPQYYSCVDNNFQPSDLQAFGGTSESAPLTAGAAALVIQAYRQAHGGASPTPDTVRRVLDSTADDAGLPAELQGSGLLDSYRAVQLAASIDAAPAPTGDNLLLDRGQASVTTTPGRTARTSFTVTNPGSTTQQVEAGLRAVDDAFGNQAQRVFLSRTQSPTFVDGYGRLRSYTLVHFTVPAGVDKMDAVDAWHGPPFAFVRISLLDPDGAYAAFSQPQGAGNVGRAIVRSPQPGTWTAIVWSAASPLGYTGRVDLKETFYRNRVAGTVTPSAFSLAPGASRTVKVATPAPDSASSAATLTLAGSSGRSTQASVVTTSVTPLRSGTATIQDRFTTGNGRDFSPAETRTYFLQVPQHAAALDVRLDLAGRPDNTVVAHLSDPTGEPIATAANAHASGTTPDTGLQLLHAHPMAGRWQLTLELTNPATRLPQPYTVTASLDAADVSARGVPTSGRTAVSRSRGERQRIRITNTGPAPQTYFVDARTDQVETLPLVAAEDASDNDPFTAAVDLPLATEEVPAWLTPIGSTAITVDSHSSAPLTFDLMPLDSPTAINAPSNPDSESTTGVDATVTHAADPLASVLWAAFPTLIGPSPADGEAPQTDQMTATVTTLGFARDYRASTGDPMLATVDPDAPAATGITVQPGQTVTVRLRLRPTGAVGDVEHGHLYVGTLPLGGDQGLAGFADVAAAIPFRFRVAS